MLGLRDKSSVTEWHRSDKDYDDRAHSIDKIILKNVSSNDQELNSEDDTPFHFEAFATVK